MLDVEIGKLQRIASASIFCQKGALGAIGSVSGKVSEADICASGDEHSMFEEGELDFVVSRHNLEHYHDHVKALKEWIRVLKINGHLAFIVPDEKGLNAVGKRTMNLDSTHYHVFTEESLKNLIELLGGLELLKCEPVVPNWSLL